jgi:hypothetical protein
MSILTELLHKKITFGEAVHKANGWAEDVIGHDQALTTAAGQALSAIKQGASDAVSAADSLLAPHLAAAAEKIEAALEQTLASATDGLSVPLNPLIDAGVDKIAAIAKQVGDTWALEVKARLTGQVAAAAAGGETPAPQPAG